MFFKGFIQLNHLKNQIKKIEDKMSSFHYKVDFSNDTIWMIVFHKKCCGFLLHSKHILIIDLKKI